MSYRIVSSLNLGQEYTGVDLAGQLYASGGTFLYGDLITAGFYHVGSGCYLFDNTYDGGFYGHVAIYQAGTSGVLGLVDIPPKLEQILYIKGKTDLID